jgi:Pyruvate:ferredoxin oxidoreductase and related 2-oxoacid:ferredoxin oxidoreductases, beta subunit
MRDDWFREDRLPHIYCAGCGNGTIMNCVLEAVSKTGWDQTKTVFLSGIGCSSRAPGYIMTDSLHTTHGRALAFATGVKNGKPIPACRCVYRGWRPCGNWWKPLHPCMPKKYRYHCGLYEQPHLWHDWRSG